MAKENEETIEAWRHEAFGDYPSPTVMAARGNLEMAELVDAVAMGQPPEKIAEEAADVFILLCGICGSLGLKLEWAVDRKMEINRKRKWKASNGIGHHIHEDPANG